jgi:pyruvate dehydrogenase E1 component alpha subunit
VDGNDVLAVLAVTRAALDAARRGEGPQLIEAVTYRMGAHTTSDDPSRYRAPADVERWRERDPIRRVRLLLEREDLAEPTFFDEVDAAADELAKRLRRGCRALPDPAPAELFAHVYTQEPALLAGQRDELVEYLASFEDEQ